MKNAIGAIIILFVVYLHLLVVPPRNLRGQYYKNPSRTLKECNKEYECLIADGAVEPITNVCDKDYVEQNKTESCYGVCLVQTTHNSTNGDLLFRGLGCAQYCEDYCTEAIAGFRSCFSCCDTNRCN
ncbi:uncharacterized protein [Apostichopus japonicus]|uniref:uncharacterized protein n=1 Tax=Stichopus japonicus TaxID=307972 RepID=UPI003AB2830B